MIISVPSIIPCLRAVINELESNNSNRLAIKMSFQATIHFLGFLRFIKNCSDRAARPSNLKVSQIGGAQAGFGLFAAAAKPP